MDSYVGLGLENTWGVAVHQAGALEEVGGGQLWESLYLFSVCRQWGAIVESSTKFEF